MRRTLWLSGVLFAGLAGPASAVEVALLPARALTRGTGAPQVFRLEFPAFPGAPASVVIRNGAEDGGDRVSTAVVRLNGRVIQSPDAFPMRAAGLASTEAVEARNVLEVELRSAPGSKVAVSVTQDVPAHGAAVIGPGGGALEVTDPSSVIHRARLEVPAGALAEPRLIWVNPAPDAPVFSDGAPGFSAVRLEPTGLVFTNPARLTLPYRPEWLDADGSLGEESLGVFSYDETIQAWTSLATDGTDVEERTVTTATVLHFSLFSLKDDLVLERKGDGRLVACAPGAKGEPEYLPVVLVHGLQPKLTSDEGETKLLCGYGPAGPETSAFGELGTLLADAGAVEDPVGADVFVYSYDSGRRIEVTSALFARALAKVRRCYRDDPEAVTVIAHSQGGLVARATIENAPPGDPAPVFALATLATPHLGSPWPVLVDALLPRLRPGIEDTCPSLRQLAACSSFLEGADACETSSGGLDGRTRLNPQKPESAYHLFAGATDVIVSQNSALGTTPGFEVFEPPAFATEERVKVLVPGGCGADGVGLCGHGGIANITSRRHVMWPYLRDLVKAGTPGRFEMLILGAYGAKVLDDRGRPRGTLDIPTSGGGASAVLSPGGGRLLYTVGVGGGRYEFRLHDFSTRHTSTLFQRDWSQTIQWVPASESEFVYNTPAGTLNRHDLGTHSDTLWQANDTIGGRVYRGGLYWDAEATGAIFQAGYGGAGGDGVYIGTACNMSDPAAAHHLCGIAAVDVPGGGSYSWDTIAGTPRLSSDGLFGYYVRRYNWTDHQLVRARLEPPFDKTVLHAFTSWYGSVAALHADRSLLGWGSSSSPAAAAGLWKCDLKKMDACREIFTAASWNDVGPIVTARRFPRP